MVPENPLLAAQIINNRIDDLTSSVAESKTDRLSDPTKKFRQLLLDRPGLTDDRPTFTYTHTTQPPISGTMRPPREDELEYMNQVANFSVDKPIRIGSQVRIGREQRSRVESHVGTDGPMQQEKSTHELTFWISPDDGQTVYALTVKVPPGTPSRRVDAFVSQLNLYGQTCATGALDPETRQRGLGEAVNLLVQGRRPEADRQVAADPILFDSTAVKGHESDLVVQAWQNAAGLGPNPLQRFVLRLRTQPNDSSTSDHDQQS